MINAFSHFFGGIFFIGVALIFFVALIFIYKAGFRKSILVWASVFLNSIAYLFLSGTQSVFLQILLMIAWPLVNVFLLLFLFFRLFVKKKS